VTGWALLAALAFTVQGDTIRDGRDLVRAMHERYSSTWYRTLSFEQRTTFYDVMGQVDREEAWSEYMRLPGRIRIDIGARDQGNYIIFRADSVYQFRNGELAISEPRVHSLLVLGFDVYRAPPDETLARLDSLGFDLSLVREARWQNRAAYVVGAPEGDLASPQFWVDASDLIFVRQIRPAESERGSITEVQFNRYEPIGGGWIAQEVVFLVDGVMRLREEYSNLQPDVKLDDIIFDPVGGPAPRSPF
jgi:hypothetical protein